MSPRRAALALGPPAAFVAMLLAGWWAATEVVGVRPFILPPPGQVVAVFTDRADLLWRATGTTAVEVAAGYLLAAAGGVALGAVLASWPPLSRAVLPTLVGLDAVPKLALAPLLVIWLGFGLTPKVVIVVATCLLPVVLATIAGLSATPVEHVELARSLNGSWWRTLVKVRFPGAVPRIFVGLKIAAPLAVIGAVIGEFFGAVAGLGYVVRAAGGDTALVYAALSLLAVMSLALFYTVAGLERLAAPWARHVNA